MLRICRVDSGNKDFRALVQMLDTHLQVRDGNEHAFYDQYNDIGNLTQVIVAYLNYEPAGCGALKEYGEATMEVKRMYVPPHLRGKGIASSILSALESWAVELGSKKCILETGLAMPEAIALYRKNGYKRIPNYGQYVGVENSVCFEKEL